MHKKALELKNIHKRFGPLEVLKGVSFSANEGEIVSMLGSSGSGKSTLLRCINLLEIPDEGEVIVSGELIRMKTKKKQRKPADTKQVNRIRSGLGMVFQSFNLWANMTARQNVIEAPIHVLKTNRSEAKKRADALLEKVGIYDKRHYYPSQLSGGQQQRVAIARALAMEPKVMLFDEPTSALDPELVGEVLRVIRTLAEEKRTMLIVTHEISFARDISDHVVFLDNGQIELEGTAAEVIDDPKSERCRKFLSLGS